jgi:hypothetical protein
MPRITGYAFSMWPSVFIHYNNNTLKFSYAFILSEAEYAADFNPILLIYGFLSILILTH